VRLGTLRRARAYAQPLGLWTAEHRALLRDAARAVLAEVLVRLGAVYEGET
jgi:hypothetical protein